MHLLAAPLGGAWLPWCFRPHAAVLAPLGLTHPEDEGPGQSRAQRVQNLARQGNSTL